MEASQRGSQQPAKQQQSSKKESKPDGISVDNLSPDVNEDDKTADLGPSTPRVLRRLAEDLPEKDEVQEAYKAAMTATDQGDEARAKLAAAEASPNAMDTPSGYALKESASVSNDTERGEVYERARQERRWGWAPVEGDK